MNCVGQVTGDEKYEWLILNDVIRKSSIGVGIVYWSRLSGSFFGIRYLYLWYSHTISVSIKYDIYTRMDNHSYNIMQLSLYVG